jgi:hypothetical protein
MAKSGGPIAQPPARAKKIFAMLMAVAIVLPVCYSLLTSMMVVGHDAPEYLPRQIEFDRNISEGILFPQWAPDFLLGNGEPLFEFNPPMFYYLAEAWHLLGFDFITAINLACVLLVVASAWGMFLLGRLYFGYWGGWLAAAAYLYAPYFAVNLYVRTASAEFAAFAFYPFALYGFGAYAQSRKRGYLVLGSLGYAGVLLSHSPAALFFTPLLLAFLLLTAHQQRSWATLGNQLAGWLLGIGLGACVWLPSLVEGKYISLPRLLLGIIRYSYHFVYWRQFLYSRWGYGLSVPGDRDEISFALGWSHLLLIAIVLALAAKLRGTVSRAWLLLFAAATLLYCFMMSTSAAPIWDRVTFLQLVGYPWRLLGPACVCLAMLIAPLGKLAGRLPRAGKAIIVGAALLLLIVPNLSHNHPKKYSVEDLSRWTPEFIRASRVEPTYAYEYAPRWVERMLYVPGGRRISGDVTMQWTTQRSTSRRGESRATVSSIVEAPITWFPGWIVLIDNRQVEAGPGETTGLTRFEVPPGTHQIEIVFKRTLPRLVGQLVSCASALFLGLIAALQLRSVFRRRKNAAATGVT